MCFSYLLMLYVFCVSFEAVHAVVAEGGIVRQYMQDGDKPVNTSPLKTLTPGDYPTYLECYYEHNFMTTKETTDEFENQQKHISQHRHVFFLQCVKFKSPNRAYVYVFFNALPIERLTVTSCDKDDVQKSIFPSRPDHVVNQRYSQVYDNYVTLSLPPYLIYKDVSGECYQRSYMVSYDDEERRFVFKGRQKKNTLGCPELSDVKFNCRAPSKELKSTVIGFADPHHTIPLTLDLLKEPGTKKHLECTVPLPGRKTSDFSYNLICVKALKKHRSKEEKQLGIKYKFVAFINFGSFNGLAMERFTVKSCIEDDIVNGIFPGRLNIPESTVPRIEVKHVNGKCYEHVYRQEESKYIRMQHQEIPCPSEALDWVHPSVKLVGAVMWLSCRGPKSTSGLPKTLQ